MMHTFVMRGVVAREIYEWLSTNYPIANNCNDPKYIMGHDWSIANYSLSATIEWYFRKNPLDELASVPVMLTNDDQIVMFKLNFGEHILMEK